MTGAEKRAQRTVLVLHAPASSQSLEETGLVSLVDSLARAGASVTVLQCDGDFDAAAEAIRGADSVVYWR